MVKRISTQSGASRAPAAPVSGNYGYLAQVGTGTDGKEENLLYSTIDSLVVGTAAMPDFPDLVVLDQSCSLQIQATNLILTGSYRMPGLNVVIVARSIQIPKGSDVVIDVSGKDSDQTDVENKNPDLTALQDPPASSSPSDPPSAKWGVDGEPGKPCKDTGPNGGSITIIAATIDVEGTLKLYANGGQGGKGQDGMVGTNGADGSYQDTVTTQIPSYSGPGGTSWSEPTTVVKGTALSGGKGGNGGAAAPGCTGGDGGTIVLHGKVTSTNLPVLTVNAGVPGNPGTPGRPGANGKDGGYRTILEDVLGTHINSISVVSCPLPSAGAAPTGGDDGNGGINGKPGTIDISADCSDLATRYDAAWLLMLLQDYRARIVLSGPPAPGDAGTADWKAVGDDLAWLKDLLAPIQQSTTDLETERKFLIAAEVRRLFGQHVMGRSVDGRDATWAPPLTFEKIDAVLELITSSYDQLSTQVAAALQDLGSYIEQATKDTGKRADLTAAVAGAQTTISVGDASLKDLNPQLQDSDNTMELLWRRTMQDATNIETLKDQFSCPTPNQLFTAAQQIAFSPEMPMIATQVGELLYNGYNTLDGLNGAVDKKYTFEQLTSLGDDILTDGKQAMQNGTEGALGVKALTAKVSSFEALLRNVQHSIPGASDMLTLLTSFDQAIKVRGDLLARYNGTVQAIIGAQKARDLAQKHLDGLGAGEYQNANPLRTGILQLLMHQQQVERERLLLHYLGARQAWSFRYLADPKDDDSWMEGALYVSATGSFNAADIANRIRTLRETAPDEEAQLGPLKQVPEDPKARSDIQVVIRDNELLSALRSNQSFCFTLDLTADPTAKIYLPANIQSKGNLHVLRVQPRLEGFTGPRSVILRTAQTGRSRVVFADRDRTFTHPNVAFDFTWDSGSTPDFGTGGDGSADISGDFTPPGLLGTWQVEITADEANQGLDLTKVTGIVFDFACLYNAMDSSQDVAAANQI